MRKLTALTVALSLSATGQLSMGGAAFAGEHHAPAAHAPAAHAPAAHAVRAYATSRESNPTAKETTSATKPAIVDTGENANVGVAVTQAVGSVAQNANNIISQAVDLATTKAKTNAPAEKEAANEKAADLKANAPAEKEAASEKVADAKANAQAAATAESQSATGN